jgi:hypothetical protein
MIAVKTVAEAHVSYYDVLRRSAVAQVPNAIGYLEKFLQTSQESWVGYINDEVACIYGIQTPTLLSMRAYMWILTTDVVDSNKFTFVRHSQLIVEKFLKDYDLVWGDTHVKDVRAQKWLKWLGATYVGRKGDFMQFIITGQNFRERRWRTR